jgi:predicted nucleic acid-binding protein
MIAVSNTTPLRYLLVIGQQALFQKLFEKVLIPSAVFEELTAPKTPAFIRNLVSSRPAWLEVRDVPDTPSGTFPSLLHRGERQAILLAEAVGPDLLLLDDRAGRKEALGRNLSISGTLGVLERGDALGHISDLPAVLQRLKASGFSFRRRWKSCFCRVMRSAVSNERERLTQSPFRLGANPMC